MVTEPVAEAPLLPAVLETSYQLLASTVTVTEEVVQVAVVPLYVKVPVRTAFQSVAPSAFLLVITLVPVFVFVARERDTVVLTVKYRQVTPFQI